MIYVYDVCLQFILFNFFLPNSFGRLEEMNTFPTAAVTAHTSQQLRAIQSHWL